MSWNRLFLAVTVSKTPDRWIVMAIMGMITGLLVSNVVMATDEAPAPSPTVQEDKGASAESGEVQERAVPRTNEMRDLSGSARPAGKALVPSGGTMPGQAIMLAAPAPAIGPPGPVSPVKELPIHLLITNLKDATGKNIGVRGQVDTAIATANANMAQQQSVRAKVSVESFTVFGAGMSATTYTDRPNHRYVRIPYMVGYQIYDVQKNVAGSWVSTGVTRHLSQSITIQMFCDRWETGIGSLKLVTAIDRPYMEPNQGTIEQVVDFFLNGHLTNFIDSQVRQQIGAIPIKNGSTNLPLVCNALGANQGVVGNPTDDLVLYSDYQPRIPIATGATALNQMTVKLMSLKRLVAHDLRGAVLYQPSEAPALEVYANSQHFYQPLQALQEGQQVALTAPPLVLNSLGATETLVLVANIIQNVAVNTQPTDSAFMVFDKNANFGNGMRTLRITKFYTVPFNPQTGAKPYRVSVDAYELTVQINAPGNLVADPGLGTAPTPGTVKPGIFNQAIPGTILKRGIEGEQPDNSTVQPQTEPQTAPGSAEGGAPAPIAP